MEIEVKYDQLYNLGEKLKNHNVELNNDYTEINAIAESLVDVLHGLGQVALYNRIKNFNENQFKKVVDYTDILGNSLENCAKIYNSEEVEFEGNMKKEAVNYEQ